jgi:predicted ArsR family transcriptional regulator
VNDRRRRPREADLHVLRAVVETGGVAEAGAHLGITQQAVRHRLHRLYRERGIQGGSMAAARAVWLLRDELEAI